MFCLFWSEKENVSEMRRQMVRTSAVERLTSASSDLLLTWFPLPLLFAVVVVFLSLVDGDVTLGI